ncbi:MAG: hypothetical protein L0220_30720, partial [Acidobacteria bacterium]|nr:hypothetical protein [Acidobacteriota bacterium]
MLALFIVLPAAAQQPENIEKKVENPIGVAEEEKKAQRLTNPQQITIVAQVEPGKSEEVAFLSEKQEVQGDVYILTGNVQVTYGDILVIADRATYN